MFQKKDQEKPRMDLLEPDFMLGVAQVLTFGAEKYGAHNWKKAEVKDIERIKGAMLRHQMAYIKGEIEDPETGLNHMYHIACNAMFLSYFDKAPKRKLSYKERAHYRGVEVQDVSKGLIKYHRDGGKFYIIYTGSQEVEEVYKYILDYLGLL